MPLRVLNGLRVVSPVAVVPDRAPLTYEHLRIRQEGQANDQNQGDLNVAWEQKETTAYLVDVETRP